ncbi:class I SAM-dependent methyltransferase [Desulfovibrio sp. SGI.169]|uniref:class I SAM-dependent methyltransferase n=1 Tax=Desulfovibrio sp. SGI.169 TaxID=3420561 RepID=UPI003D03EA70
MLKMNPQDTARRDFFDAHAKGWEERNYPPRLRLRLEAMLERVSLSEGMTVLDVGCGRGVLQPYLRQRVGATGRLAALDFSSAMLEGAAQRYPFVWPLLARAERIPLLDGFVDALICFSAFPHIEDKKAAAREFHRVLKPGGRAYVIHLEGREKLNAIHDRHDAVRGDHMPCINGMRSIFGQAGFGHIESDESADHYYFCAHKED